MNEIVWRFGRLAERLAAAMATSPDLRDDLANAARLALVKAVRRHDLDNPTFPAYAERYMRGAVLREYQKWAMPVTENIDELAQRAVTPKAMRAPSFMDAAIDRACPWGDGALAGAVSELGAGQSEIIRLRYVEDASLSEIASAVGTSASAVSRRLGTIHTTIARKLAA